ncbi:Uncharacterized protein Rs2_16993 [Raphanus sativus]|nr:Uncharacterized protein Rs2_16993 [Raphanus sativus]
MCYRLVLVLVACLVPSMLSTQYLIASHLLLLLIGSNAARVWYSSGVGAAFGGYALPKFAQMTVTSYYSSSSASHYVISMLTRRIEDAHLSRTRNKRSNEAMYMKKRDSVALLLY